MYASAGCKMVFVELIALCRIFTASLIMLTKSLEVSENGCNTFLRNIDLTESQPRI